MTVGDKSPIFIRMTNHSADEAVASEVRAALAKRRKTAADLAKVCGITAHTAGRRLNAAVPFTVVELLTIAEWLEVDLHDLLPQTAQVPA